MENCTSRGAKRNWDDSHETEEASLRSAFQQPQGIVNALAAGVALTPDG